MGNNIEGQYKIDKWKTKIQTIKIIKKQNEIKFFMNSLSIIKAKFYHAEPTDRIQEC